MPTPTTPRRPRPRKHSRVDVRSEHPAGARRVAPLRRSALRFLRALHLSGVELSVLLTTDSAIRELNRTWRRKDRPTDVLSFPSGEPPGGPAGPRQLGDVILSLDTARRQARAHGRTLASELDLYLAHGLLHLLGHDHHRPAEARRMGALEARLLRGPGMVHGTLGVR